MYQATDKNRGAKILSYKQLKHEFDVASLLFSGRETDNNWESRQAFFKKVKVFLPSDEAKTHKKELVDKLHEVIPKIYSTIKSIRTTLIEEALSLAETIGTYVGESINMHTNEAILRFLMNESSVTKKAIAFRAFEATNNYLAKIRFHPKILTFLCTRAQEKNPQLREFALGYIKTVLSVHGSANKSRLIEYADLMQAIAASIQKGLGDAIPTVRSACRETYSVFEELWPTEAYELAIKLDTATQRRLGFSAAQSSSAASKSAKPLIRRTSKSSPSAIKKPASSICINKTAKSDIRVAMHKPSHPASSSASGPHTHGFNLSDYSQAITRKPVQASSPVSESAKYLIRRTSKSPASAIKKPTSSVCINKAAKAGIRAAMQKPSNPAFSSALTPHTHGLDVSNHCQATTKRPAQAPSHTSESAKSLIHRTSKSPASAIKKPVSGVCTNKAAKAGIRAALQKPYNPASSSASRPHTHGLNLPNYRQAMTEKPAQTPSPAAMPHTERDTTLGTAPNAASGTMMETVPSTDSNAVMSTAPNTTSILEPSPNTAINSPQVSSPQSKDDPPLTPKPNSQDLSSSFHSQESPPSLDPRELSSSISSQEIASQPTEPSFVAAKNLSRPVKIPSRRGSRVLPSPTSSSSNERIKKSLRLTSSNSTAIKKSTRPKLRKCVNLFHKYDHVTSRYKNIPKH